MPAEEQTDDIKVKGCVAGVCARVPSMRSDALAGDSDALITKGLLALLIQGWMD